MEFEHGLMLFAVAIFAAQLCLCFKAKRIWIKLIPILFVLLLQLVMLIWYAVSAWTNWACLIILILLLIPLAAAIAAWIIRYIAKIISRMSIKNT